jgi:ferredoxin
MDRIAAPQDQLAFHLTGTRAAPGMGPVAGAALRPAAVADLSDLARLRHDFPLLLVDAAHGGGCLPLSLLVDRMLERIAPRGVQGDRLRRQVLHVEHALRAQVLAGHGGRLSQCWTTAVERVVATMQAADRADDGLAQVLTHAGSELQIDGVLHGCDAALPSHVLLHAWHQAMAGRARAFRQLTDRLIRGLSDLLRAADARSAAGQSPEALRRSIGNAQERDFDFDTLARLVRRSHPQDELPPERRERIRATLAALRWQPFYADDVPVMNCCFSSIAAALQAWQERLPQMVALVKAIAVAELETAGRYEPQRHDALFASDSAAQLGAADLALFPDLLVRIPDGQNNAPENAGLLSLLSSGVPVKVLVEIDDLTDEGPTVATTGALPFGVRPARLATTAMGLGGMFVLQAPANALPMLTERIAVGVAATGPALICIHPGLAPDRCLLPRYLSAAIALDTRAFPVFSYHASAGQTWAARFSLEGNRAPESDWATERIDYADERLQRGHELHAMTPADLALCDSAQERHFALVPRERWNAAMLPLADWLALDAADAAERVPYVLAVDGTDRLQRVIVDAAMVQAVRRTRLLWRRLQEHAGIHDSHAERLLAEERARVAAASAASAAVPVAVLADAAPAAQATATVEDAAPRAAPGQPWIETARCPSCNECQNINPRMFAYNDNKQAYIGDLQAGTFRQMVEAAESCQVAIIHPGAPWNSSEPGLEDLIERARPFQ